YVKSCPINAERDVTGVPFLRERVEPACRNLQFTAEYLRKQIALKNLNDKFNIISFERMAKGRFWLFVSEIPAGCATMEIRNFVSMIMVKLFREDIHKEAMIA